jgi:hypothetical protein
MILLLSLSSSSSVVGVVVVKKAVPLHAMKALWGEEV